MKAAAAPVACRQGLPGESRAAARATRAAGATPLAVAAAVMEAAVAPAAYRQGLPGGSRASAARAAGMAPLAGVAMATAAVTAPVVRAG